MPLLPPPTPEHWRLIRKLESISPLDDDDRTALSAIPLRTRTIEAGVDIIPQGAVPTECCFVVEGLVCRYAVTGAGTRQIVSFHIPGDLPDRDSLHLAELDHSVGSLSPARVAFIPHAPLTELLLRRPNIAVAFWRDGVVDAAIFRQWLTSLGRRSARQRIAHVLCEMYARMDALSLADRDHFSFPVTQPQLADALGLSAVHVNRTLQELRQAGLLAWKGSVVNLIDLAALREISEFDPSYLRLRSMPH